MNKGRVCGAILVGCASIFFCFCKPLLLFIGLDAQVVEYAHLYMMVQIPGLFLLAQYEILRALVMASGEMQLGLFVGCANIFLHIFWNFVFVVWLDWGIVGTSMASNLSFTFFYVSMSFLLSRYEKYNYIQKIHLDNVFSGFQNYISQCFYSITTKCFNAWVIVGTSFVGCTFSVTAAAVVGVITSLIPFLKMYAISML